MDIADHLRLCQGEEVTVVQQILCRILEARSANVGFLHAVGSYRRAHRSIDDGDTAFEDLLKGMLVSCHHFVPGGPDMKMSASDITPRYGFPASLNEGKGLAFPLGLTDHRFRRQTAKAIFLSFSIIARQRTCRGRSRHTG